MNIFILTIFMLIFAHVFADWSLQGSWMSENKGKYWIVMLAHCVVWTGCICLALDFLSTSRELLVWWDIPILLIPHYLIDSWKCRVYAKKPFCQQSSAKHLYIDQALHLLQLAVVYTW